MIWHILSTISDDSGPVEVMAAADCDGIGVIARWVKRGSGWRVFATDTEQCGMVPIDDFGEEECVPSEPPLANTP